MRTIGYLAAAVLAASCGGKKTEDGKPAPTPGSSVAGSGAVAAAGSGAAGSGSAAAGSGSAGMGSGSAAVTSALVPVTTKSPEAQKVFEQGRELVDGDRGAEAVALFKKAIELDPDFAQAHAYLGIVTPGPAGVVALDKAKTLAAKLPDAERLVIEGAQAARAGNHAAMLAAYTKVSELAPGDWRIWLSLGWDASDTGDPAKAVTLFEKALAVKADLALAQDGLAYSHAGLREWDAAIAAAKKQVELLPKQPSPEDTLGEMLLLAGKFDDAEKAFQAAIDLEPKYNIAWQGIELARAYRGDWKGAFTANDSQNAGAVDTYDSVNVITDGAWLALAAGNLPDAIARLDVIEKDPEAKKTPAYAFAALDRASILQLSDKFADAATWLETGRKRGDALPGPSKALASRAHAIGVLRNAAWTAKAAPDADALVTGLDQAATAGGDPTSQSYVAWGKGLAAWAKSGPKDAVAELSKCRVQLVGCRYDLADAQRKGGDTAAADATEKQVRELPQRDASAVYYITDLAPEAAGSGAAGSAAGSGAAGSGAAGSGAAGSAAPPRAPSKK